MLLRNRLVVLTVAYTMYIRVVIFFCLQMPDVGSDGLLLVNFEYYFLFA